MSRRIPRQSDALALTAADADAFDSLVEAGWEPAALPPFLQRRASAVCALLAPLDAPPSVEDQAEAKSRAALVERTLARVAREANGARRDAPPMDDAPPTPALSPEEQAAVDALVANGWDPQRARAELAERSEHLADIAALLERLKCDSPATADESSQPVAEERGLVERTLQLVQEEIDRSERLRRLGSPAPGVSDAPCETPRLRVGARLWDVVGVAAAVALAASVLMPILGTIRQRAMRATGASRLADAGLGFTLYGADHFGALPAIAPSEGQSPAAFTAGSTWWNVGQPQASHSANLFLLARQEYTSLESLASPGNPLAPVRLDLAQHHDWRRPEEISFSYQLFPHDEPLRFSDFSQRGVLLADRSPVTARSLRGEPSQATAGSPNQRGWGLLVLFSDGAVDWLRRPVLESGDNVWLPAFAEGASARVLLYGVERPASKKDAFVGP